MLRLIVKCGTLIDALGIVGTLVDQLRNNIGTTMLFANVGAGIDRLVFAAGTAMLLSAMA